MKRRVLNLAVPYLLMLCANLQAAELRTAIVIGISNYEKYSKVDQLKYAALDALGFTAFLSEGKAGDVKVKSLYDENGRRDAIWDAVDELKAGPRPDTVFLFFSGHAELDPLTAQYYLMPSDGDKNRLEKTAIQAKQLISTLEAIGPRNLVIFLDACHSGAAVGGKGTKTGESISQGLANVIAEYNGRLKGSVLLFVSAGANQLSWEDDEGARGIFTRLLIKGLEGDADGTDGIRDGRITAGKLKSFLDREVPLRARQLGKPAQIPFVNADFNSDFLISMTSRPVPSASVKAGEYLSLDRIQQLRKTDSQLALMLQVGAVKTGVAGPGVTSDMRAVQVERPMKRIASLQWPVSLEATTGAVISSDGSLLVACTDPSSLVVFGLNNDRALGQFQLPLPSGVAGRRVTLDSCEISVSRDNRFAAVSVRGDNGAWRLSVFGLGQSRQPILSPDEYERGVFLGDFLVLASKSKVKATTIGTWTDEIPVIGSRFPVESIASQPDGAIFGTVTGGGICAWRFDPDKHAFVNTICSSASGEFGMSLVVTKDWIATKSACGASACRLFPTGLPAGPRGWWYMFQIGSEPKLIRFASADGPSAPVELPDEVFVARLLANGKALIVGRNGDVYQFDSLPFGDCCTIPTSNAAAVLRLAVGHGHMVAVLTSSRSPNARLEVFQGSKLIQSALVPELSSREMIWSGSGKSLAIFGERETRVIEFLDLEHQKTVVREFTCGGPAGLNASGTKLACISPETGKVEFRDVRSGRIERVFDHNGPVQVLTVSDDMITAVGSYSGRKQTVVTLWDVSLGRLVSERKCPIGGNTASTPLGLLHKSRYFAQLETPNRLVIRNSLTCEVKIESPTIPDGVDRIRTAIDSDTMLLQQSRSNVAPSSTAAFFLLQVFTQGAPMPARFGLPIDDIEISADGEDVVLQAGGRVLLVPVTQEGLLEVAQRQIAREFTKSECEQFFPAMSCPSVMPTPQHQ